MLWVALVDGVCLATVDPRLVVETFGRAWPAEDNESVLNRVAAAVLGRIIQTFLPPAEQVGAEGGRGEGSPGAARAQRARGRPRPSSRRGSSRAAPTTRRLLRDWAATAGPARRA